MLFFIWWAFADRNLPGVNIITRTQWWADETRRYESQPTYQSILTQRKSYEEYLLRLKEQDLTKYIDLKKKDYDAEQKLQTQNNYLSNNFLNEVKLDKVVDEETGNALRWPNKYKYDKDRIVIHHTAASYDNQNSKEEIMAYIRNTYKYHAFTRAWGDIWYNFLIDKYWNIYEWKAGWEGIVAAHSSWNNASSIWIALIWNFEIQEPTTQQLQSLKTLLVALSKKYKIDPYEEVTYHKESDASPYLKDYDNDSIVWHKDTGFTACPWRYLYDKLDMLKKYVSDELNWNSTSLIDSWWTEILQVKNLPGRYIVWLWVSDYVLKTSISASGELSCSSNDLSVKILWCTIVDWKLEIQLRYQKALATWKKSIFVVNGSNRYQIVASMVWLKDIPAMIENMKKSYYATSWTQPATTRMNKIEYKVSLQEAKELMNKNLNVLLYEASTTLDKWTFTCKAKCTVWVDSVQIKNITSIEVNPLNNSLEIELDWKPYDAKNLHIFNNTTLVIDNYKRASYAWIWWSEFSGDIVITKDAYKDLATSNYKTKYVLINQVAFDDYMRWIAEMNDQQEYQKIKAMALVIKSYTLFYASGKNIHPSIPSWTQYNAVDDARIFQKYVGAWYQKTAKKWFQALKETEHEIIIYDNFVPILPYYNCSIWFTLSWLEKWWWQDTPYLQSQLDFEKCPTFNWHWVWLSGNGAQMLAKKWVPYKTIIQYYYTGVKIEKI